MQEDTAGQNGSTTNRRIINEPEASRVASNNQAVAMTSSPGPKTRKRHGARNQHKTGHFVRWLLKTFPHLDGYNKKDVTLEDTPLVVDVAGGKGECTARLSLCHRLRVVFVDPRECDPVACFQKEVLPRLPRAWRDRIYEKLQDDPRMLEERVSERVSQLQMYVTDETVESCAELQDALQDAELILGLHADGATECIVDAAIKYQKPFCVVPCCVFPNLFRQRFIQVADKETGELNSIQVRSTEHFCQYLLEKHPRFQRSVLPFEGRNVAIWWDGKN